MRSDPGRLGSWSTGRLAKLELGLARRDAFEANEVHHSAPDVGPYNCKLPRRHAVGPRAHGKVRKSYRDRETERERGRGGAGRRTWKRGALRSSRPISTGYRLPPWPTSRWPLEFFCEMLRRNVAQKCCAREMLPHIFLAGGSQDGISTLTAEKKNEENGTSRCRRRLCEKKKKLRAIDRTPEWKG